MTMSKVVKLTEGKSLQIRVDATNIFNHANPSGNSSQSGVVRVRVPSAPNNAMGYYYDGIGGTYALQPLGYINSKVGARTFQARLRIDF